MNNKEFSVKGIYWFYLISIIVMPLGFLIRYFYSHTISVAEVGIIYSMINFFGFVSVFTNFGFSLSLRYFIPKFLVKEKYQEIINIFYYAVILQAVLLTFFSILFYFFAKFIVINYFHNADFLIFFKIFIFYFIALNVFNSINNLLISFKLNLKYQISNFIRLLIILLFSIGGYFIAKNNLTQFYAYSWTLGPLVAFIIYLIYIFIKFPFLLKFPKWDKKLFKEYFSYSFHIFLSNIGMVILSQTDILVVTYFLSIQNVAFYSNAVALINVFTSFFASVSVIFMPIFSELKEKKNFQTINNILNILYGTIFYLIFPISLILFLFANNFISIIYGAGYLPGAIILMIMSLFSIFKIFVNYNLSFVNGLGMGKILPKIVIPIALFNLIANILLINYIGLIGVAIPTILGWIGIVFFTFRPISKELKFKLNLSNIIKTIFLGIIFLFLVELLKGKFIIFNYYLTALIILIFSYLLYLILGYIFKVYSIGDFYLFIPSEKMKKIIGKYHKKYFSFLK